MGSLSQVQPILRFEQFEVDLEAEELHRDGVLVRLQRQPFRILSLLLRNPGKTVTREEFRQELWPKDTFVDFDHSLNTAINTLRKRLGHSAKGLHLIETLPRRGYRFAAPVKAVETLHSRIKIVVLPFDYWSSSPDEEYFTAGLTEEIISQLGRCNCISVIARTSSMQCKSRQMSLSQIGQELGVGYILDGSVRRDEQTLRISVQLIRVDDQTPVWTEIYDRELTGILSLQMDVAWDLVDKVCKTLAPNMDGMTFSDPPNFESAAHEAYIRGH